MHSRIRMIQGILCLLLVVACFCEENPWVWKAGNKTLSEVKETAVQEPKLPQWPESADQPSIGNKTSEENNLLSDSSCDTNGTLSLGISTFRSGFSSYFVIFSGILSSLIIVFY